MNMIGSVQSEAFNAYLEKFFAGYTNVLFIGPTSSARRHLNDLNLRNRGPLHDWFADNVKGEWKGTDRYIGFKDANDAFAFKMRFG